jgi:hypothetical protein
MVDLLCSPFADVFHEFYGAVTSRCFLCSPYITQPPIRNFIHTADQRGILKSLRLQVLTDISAPNIIQGATDLGALALLMDTFQSVEIRYLPRVHAKVFLADDVLALIGSANLTDGGLSRNYEYGVRLRDAEMVQRTWSDLTRYAELGASVTRNDLTTLQEQVEQVRAATVDEQRTLREKTRLLTQKLQSEVLERRVEDQLIGIRITGRTIHAIFCETLLYLLAQRDMAAAEMATLVQHMHPDLCGDEDRVINGQSFGKKWKHHLRTARGTLQRKGLIHYLVASGNWTAGFGKERA